MTASLISFCHPCCTILYCTKLIYLLRTSFQTPFFVGGFLITSSTYIVTIYLFLDRWRVNLSVRSGHVGQLIKANQPQYQTLKSYRLWVQPSKLHLRLLVAFRSLLLTKQHRQNFKFRPRFKNIVAQSRLTCVFWSFLRSRLAN